MNIIRKMEQNRKNKQWDTKSGKNISPEHKSYFRDCPQKSGTNGRLSVSKPNLRLWLRWKHIRANSSVREYDPKRPNRTNPLEPPEMKYVSESRYILRRSNTCPRVHNIFSRTQLPTPTPTSARIKPSCLNLVGAV
jgi:hypothetical protein